MCNEEFLTTSEAAKYLDLKAKTLVWYRSVGRGPAYRKDRESGAVRYTRAALDEYRRGVSRRIFEPERADEIHPGSDED